MAENFRHGSRRIAFATARQSSAETSARQPRRKANQSKPNQPRDSLLRRNTLWSKNCRKRLFPPTATPAARRPPRLPITSSKSCAKASTTIKSPAGVEGLRLIDLMSQHYNGEVLRRFQFRRKNRGSYRPFRQRSHDRSSRSPILSRAETPDHSRLLHLQDRHSRRTGIQGQSDAGTVCRLRRSRAKVFVIASETVSRRGSHEIGDLVLVPLPDPGGRCAELGFRIRRSRTEARE